MGSPRARNANAPGRRPPTPRGGQRPCDWPRALAARGGLVDAPGGRPPPSTARGPRPPCRWPCASQRARPFNMIDTLGRRPPSPGGGEPTTAPRSTSGRSAAQHSTAPRGAAPRGAARRSAAQPSATQRSAVQCSAARRIAARRGATQHSAAQHGTAQHSASQHSPAERSRAEQRAKTKLKTPCKLADTHFEGAQMYDLDMAAISRSYFYPKTSKLATHD